MVKFSQKKKKKRKEHWSQQTSSVSWTFFISIIPFGLLLITWWKKVLGTTITRTRFILVRLLGCASEEGTVMYPV
jgi:hypothetical protein